MAHKQFTQSHSRMLLADHHDIDRNCCIMHLATLNGGYLYAEFRSIKLEAD